MLVLIFVGITTILVSFLLLIRPDIGFEFARKHFLSVKFQYGIGVVSLLLAAAIYYTASESKFPALFQLFALFSLVGAVIVFVLPQKDFRSIVSWELTTFSPYARALGLIYALVGSFIIYAAI